MLGKQEAMQRERRHAPLRARTEWEVRRAPWEGSLPHEMCILRMHVYACRPTTSTLAREVTCLGCTLDVGQEQRARRGAQHAYNAYAYA